MADIHAVQVWITKDYENGIAAARSLLMKIACHIEPQASLLGIISQLDNQFAVIANDRDHYKALAESSGPITGSSEAEILRNENAGLKESHANMHNAIYGALGFKSIIESLQKEKLHYKGLADDMTKERNSSLTMADKYLADMKMLKEERDKEAKRGDEAMKTCDKLHREITAMKEHVAALIDWVSE